MTWGAPGSILAFSRPFRGIIGPRVGFEYNLGEPHLQISHSSPDSGESGLGVLKYMYNVVKFTVYFTVCPVHIYFKLSLKTFHSNIFHYTNHKLGLNSQMIVH